MLIWSLSARRAWIEITQCKLKLSKCTVALRKESVDRNQAADISTRRGARSLSARRAWIEIIDDFEQSITRKVALRKESVDRNPPVDTSSVKVSVALRKESVDRNICMKEVLPWVLPSLSARRAWIEIAKSTPEEAKRWVALRKESVDRNK